jgi:hypothetical protein
MSTGEIARAIGRSVPGTSNIRGALRFAELALPQLLRGIKQGEQTVRLDDGTLGIDDGRCRVGRLLDRLAS